MVQKTATEIFGENYGQVSAYANLINFSTQYQRTYLPAPTICKLEAPAGRGKTFVARMVIDFLKKYHITVTATAFTGRAAKQLAKSGIEASTFHSILYEAVLDEKENLKYFRKRDRQDILERVGNVILIDEGSMVPSEIANIILELGLPIIVMGDSEQLESIEDDGRKYSMLKETIVKDLFLRDNVRFTEESGIGRLCNHLREEDSLPIMKAQDLKMIPKMKINREKFHVENKFDLIICGTNGTRRKMNDLVRKARGYYDEECEFGIPKIGEQVVCLQNNVLGGKKIANGELFTVQSVIPASDGISNLIVVSVDDGERVSVMVEDECWLTGKSQNKKIGDIPLCIFTYGYALTCHKTQGSTIENVLFIDEDVSYFLDQKKYRYTGCSRASKNLTVAK